jgi:hypothetical protein
MLLLNVQSNAAFTDNHHRKVDISPLTYDQSYPLSLYLRHNQSAPALPPVFLWMVDRKEFFPKCSSKIEA